MMEVSAVCIDGQSEETGMLQGNNSGGFLQVGGMTVVYDASAPAGGQHVLSITLDGESAPLDREDTQRQIMLVGNNYILSGGSDYGMLAGLPKAGELGGELEAVQAYFESCLADGAISRYARPQGRLVMQGGYTPADYTARVRIMSGDGAAPAGTEVVCIIDGKEEQRAVVGADGTVRLTLADGAHGVRLAGGTIEAYIDNYCGFGIVEDAFRPLPALTLEG